MIDTGLYEKLSAYNDGELGADEAAAIEHKLTQDQDLRRALLDIKHADNTARTAFDDMLGQPVPLKAVAAIDRAFSDAAAATRRQSSDWRHSWWVPAVAASFAAVLLSGVVGLFAFENYSEKLVAELEQSRQSGNRELAELLQKTLENSVSGTAVEYADPATSTRLEIVPIHTYKSRSGHWCREFSERIEIDGIVELRKGLACRENQGGWRRLSTTIEGDQGGKL